eukprot:TRINITY_DN110190_c0_g1_i1.p1 TRINITY_DN110190_c0_g1~~TRINITY_DN110190_c0_g1_i1.p1  ORF type:complete len:1307 (-),score=310.54 TRINITY_DN110190_c0_g1_i1:69-3989(-)
MQAGFLKNRSIASTSSARRNHGRGYSATLEEAKVLPDSNHILSWGSSKDILDKKDTSFDALPARKDIGRRTARFDVGDICEVVGGVLVRQSEDLDSPKVAQLSDGCRIEVTAIGLGPSGKRIAVRDTGGIEGWVSVVAASGETLIRIVEKELHGELRERRLSVAAKVCRPDHGKATERFNLGDFCDVVGGAIVRQTEELDSHQLRRLPDRSQVEVVEIGSGPTGKRVCIKDDAGRVGWISVVSADGTQLLRPVKPQPADLQPTLSQMSAQTIDTLDELTTSAALSAVEGVRPLQEALKNLESKVPETSQEALSKWEEPFALVSAARAQRGFELEVAYLERQNVDQLLAEKFVAEGIQEPNYDYVKLRDATGKWYRPGEAPDNPVPELFPITLYYRPPKPSKSAETALALRQKHALDALSPAQRQGLVNVQRQLEIAFSSGRDDLLDKAMRLAHSMGLPLGSAGLPVALMPESVCFPKGNEPLLYDGHLYSMHTSSMTVFDPPDFSTAMGVWNPRCQTIDPVKWKKQDGSQCLVHFGKTFLIHEMGHVVDPDLNQVVGMVVPMTGAIEFFDPVPMAVAEFMMQRGFRMEAPSSALTNGPFVQILPQEESDDGNPELHLTMKSTGSFKALKYAPSAERGNKEMVLKTMREATAPQSWKIMLYGTQELQADRDVLLEAVKQDYTAMPYASAFFDDKDFMLQAVQKHGLSLKYGSEDIRADPDLAYAAVKASWRAIKNVAPKLRGSTRIVREAVRQSWQALEYASEELRDDRDIVSLAVKQNWRALHFAALRLRADGAFILKASEQSVDALQYAAEDLFHNFDFMRQAIKQHGIALRYAAPEVAADKELVLEAVRQNWRALEHATAKLRADRAVVLEAVRQHQSALQFAAPEMCADQELVFEAARRRLDVLRAAPSSLRGDHTFMLRMVKHHPMALQYATDAIRADEELVLEAIRRNWRSFQHASSELKESRSFMLRAVQMDALVLSLADDKIREDPQVVCEAVEREWEMLEHVSEDLRGNFAFMMEAVGIEGLSLKYAAEALSHSCDLVMAAISNTGLALEFAASELRADPEVVLMAVRQDFEAIMFADEELTSDFMFMFRAIRIDGRALKGASMQLRSDPDLVLAAVGQNWRCLSFASRALRANRDFMIKAVRVDAFALAMVGQELWMDPELLAAAAAAEGQERQPGSNAADASQSIPPFDAELRQLLKQARPGWSDADLEAAEQKLAVVSVTSVPSLAQALASDLNGVLRAAGQKIFTATTIMELKARSAAAAASAAAADSQAAAAVNTAPAKRVKPGIRPNARLAY